MSEDLNKGIQSFIVHMPISSPKVDHDSSVYEMNLSKVSNEECEVIGLQHRYMTFVSRKTFVPETWCLKLSLDVFSYRR